MAPVAATLIELGISRSREYGADATGAEISGDSESLARALEKLDQAAHAIPAPVQPATASLFFIVNPFSATEGVLTLFLDPPLDAGAHPAPPRDAGLVRRVAGGSPCHDLRRPLVTASLRG